MHQYKVDDILDYSNEHGTFKCKVIKLWHLIYNKKYPTYKVLLLDKIPEYSPMIKTLIVPESALSTSL